MKNNLVDILHVNVERHPEKRLFAFLNIKGQITEEYDFRGFEVRTNFLARKLESENIICHGQPVILAFSPGLEMITAFFACIKVGAIPAPVPPPNTSTPLLETDRLIHAARDCGATHVLTTTAILNRLRDNTDQKTAGLDKQKLYGLYWHASDSNFDDTPDSKEEYIAHPNEILFLQYTSGSTRNPQGVMVSHDNVIANCNATVGLDPISISWLPHYHDMGLIGKLLFPVVTGGTSYLFSPLDFLRRPILWLEAITRYRANISSAPNFAYDYCLKEEKISQEDLYGLDLGSLQMLMNGAEPVSCQTMQRFEDKFASAGLPSTALSVSYGLAEYTLSVTLNGRTKLILSKAQLEQGRAKLIKSDEINGTDIATGRSTCVASCGTPVLGTDIRIVDPQTKIEKPKGDIGEIWLNGPSKALGYWNKPELNEELFTARIVGQSGSATYLRTGDTGFMHENELFVCGRLKDMIVVNGANIFPSDIEHTIEASGLLPAHSRSVAFGVSGQDGYSETIVLLIEMRNRDPEFDLEAVHRLILERCRISVSQIATVPRGSIIRTSSGKLARYACSLKWINKGTEPFSLFISTSDGENKDDLFTFLDRIVPVSQVKRLGSHTLGELGLDSMELVTLSLLIEKAVLKAGYNADALMGEISDLRFLQAISFDELHEFALKITGDHTDISGLVSLGKSAFDQVLSNEAALMREDAKLDTAVQPVQKIELEKDNRQILITGGNGFLGSYMVKSLLSMSKARLHILIRANDKDHGIIRLRHALSKAGLCKESIEQAMADRITIWLGDVALPRLGLTTKNWNILAQLIDSIYHSAAAVDYVKSYEDLRSTNVEGTREIIKLACQNRAKTLNAISTTFIYGWSVKPVLWENDNNESMHELDFGYAQSKWVAEQLVLEAGRRGLPVRLLRPSLITASSEHDFVRTDITARLLGYMIRHGITIDVPNQISFLPVDVCAHNIVAMAEKSKTPSQSVAMHLTCDNYYTLKDVCDIVKHQYGYQFEVTDIPGFIHHINQHCDSSDDLYPLRIFFSSNSEKIIRMGQKRYDNQHYREARELVKQCVSEPEITLTTSWIVEYLLAEHLIPAKPGQLKQIDHTSDGIVRELAQ